MTRNVDQLQAPQRRANAMREAAELDGELPTSQASAGRPTVEDVHARAKELFLAGERIDMRALAKELEIGRATLYRWCGDRDALLAHTIWAISEPVLADIAQTTEIGHGRARILAILRRIGTDLLTWEPYVRFLHREPSASLRILTTSATSIQERMRTFIEEIISEERANGSLDIPHHIESNTLAYAVLRLAEAFFYADLIAGRRPDIDQALSVIGLLLGR